MKIWLLICISLFSAIDITAQNSQIPLADPYILLDGDIYFAYGTHSENGIEYFYSTDLKKWKKGGLALSKENTTENKWFWAPEVYKLNGKYYMYYSANSHIFVAEADSPRGPFVQKGTFMLNNIIGNEPCIDSSLFQDSGGTLWLYFVRWVEGCERIFQCRIASDAVTPVANTMKECIKVDKDWEKIMPCVVEGPFVVKHKGTYFLTYSANGYQSHDYAVGYATSKEVNNTWKKSENNPFLRRYNGLLGVGHHSLFKDKKGKLRIVFHAHNSENQIHPRMMYIGTLKIKGNTIKMGTEPLIIPKLEENN